MTFTYTAGAGAKDDVRLLIGDTDVNAKEDLRLEDEEIERLVYFETGSDAPSDSASLYRAAAAAAEALAIKFARKAEGSTGPDRVQPTSRAAEMRATASRYRARGGRVGAAYAGGISKADNLTLTTDPDRIGSPFSMGMMDNRS